MSKSVEIPRIMDRPHKKQPIWSFIKTRIYIIVPCKNYYCNVDNNCVNRRHLGPRLETVCIQAICLPYYCAFSAPKDILTIFYICFVFFISSFFLYKDKIVAKENIYKLTKRIIYYMALVFI